MEYWQYLEAAEKINKNKSVNKIILVHILNQNLSWLYANLNTKGQEDILEPYLKLIKKYASGYPLGYILGYVIFKGHKLFVDKRVLIPRDETQYLIEKTLEISKEYFGTEQPLRLLDLATGSGVIAIMIAFNKNFNVVASDISSDALIVAQKNIDLYKLGNIKLVHSNLFNNLQNEKFDIIISNPPYIDQLSETYDPKRLQYEPEIALFAENKGLFFYEKILRNILNHVNKKYLIAFEFGFDQKATLEDLIKAMLPQTIDYQFVRDINNHWRYLFIKGS